MSFWPRPFRCLICLANRAVNDGFFDFANPCPTDPRPNLSREFLTSSRVAVIEAVMDNGRHMAQTAAHLTDHVIPPVPVRQWLIWVPKRLRGMLADRPWRILAIRRAGAGL